jgi:diaminopimelate decarboxylase
MRPIGLSDQVLHQAVSRYGTPLFLYNLVTIATRYHTLTDHLPSHCRVHYALKANSNLAICRHLAQLGAAAEVSSLGEFVTALKAGYAAAEIVFTGPGKPTEELMVAMEAGVGLIVVESVNEAARVNEIAHQLGTQQPVLLRINPNYRTEQSCEVTTCAVNQPVGIKTSPGEGLQPIQMNGQGASKFGIDEAAAPDALNQMQAMHHLDVQGIHVFTESNVLDYEHLLAAWRNTLTIADRLRHAGYPITTLDFGGGIGIPYNRVDAAFDMARFGKALEALLATAAYPYKCILEIGRYLVCEAGCYLTTVVDVKQSQGQPIVIINGGIHHLYRTPAMQPASKFLEVLGKTGTMQNSLLAGQLPTPIDVLVRDVPLPTEIAIGDVLAIYNCGAYGFNHALTNFTLHPHPAEVAHYHNDLSLIRSRGNMADFFTHQVLPDWDTDISSEVPLLDPPQARIFPPPTCSVA